MKDDDFKSGFERLIATISERHIEMSPIRTISAYRRLVCVSAGILFITVVRTTRSDQRYKATENEVQRPALFCPRACLASLFHGKLTFSLGSFTDRLLLIIAPTFQLFYHQAFVCLWYGKLKKPSII
jgi:hypothetical protein